MTLVDKSKEVILVVVVANFASSGPLYTSKAPYISRFVNSYEAKIWHGEFI